MSHSTTPSGAKSRRRRLRRRHDETVKLRRGGEGNWHSGSDDPRKWRTRTAGPIASDLMR